MAPQAPVEECPVAASDKALLVQLQQFLDEWFYRILASSIGKAWGRKQAVTLLLDISE